MKIFNLLAAEAQHSLEVIGLQRRILIFCLLLVLVAGMTVDVLYGYAASFVLPVWLLGIALLLCVEFFKYHPRFALIFVVVVSVALPGCFGLSLALNAAKLPVGSGLSLYWPWVYCVVLICYVHILNAGLLVIVSWIVLYSFGLLSFLLAESNAEALWIEYVLLAGAYYSIALVGAIVDRNKIIVLAQKTSRMRHFSDYVAHELRTPILGMSTRIRGLAAALKLLSGRNSHEKQLLDRGRFTVSELINQMQHISQMINFHLHKLELRSIREFELDWVDLDEFVRASLNLLPSEKKHVELRFEIHGASGVEALLPVEMMDYVIYELTKNSWDHSFKAHVDIFLEHNPVAIVFQDESNRLPISIVNKYSKSSALVTGASPDAGSGLAFCAHVANEIGGDFYIDGDYLNGCRAVFELKRTRLKSG